MGGCGHCCRRGRPHGETDPKPNSLCSMKDAALGSTGLPSDTKKDCFSNIRRQPEEAARAVMTEVGAPIPAIDTGLIYAGVGALPMVEGNWKDAVSPTNVMLQRAMARDEALE